ncbi:ATP-dependent DNA helicase [Desulfosarcina ovata]|uniref:ATP-dependent helicase n=1 Tax=Desulfosarcina ovata subsp. ovata TaxID=2752305 RepID=A0A5K8AN16_9BACT|nr:ATP-dependent DNA helicase [Desulfosarcina ovata]BBO93014.1 ATP-dependent helicase [Desulfosarcina ovata subsp. ovata]
MKERHQIAVRTLVDYVLRSGDLDMRFTSPGRPLEGIRIHQRIQRQRPEGYRAEVSVSTEVETPGLILVVSGRIDGVLETAEATIVEEIKSTSRELGVVGQCPDPCHWGQAKVYACLLAREKDLPSVTVQLTYCQLDSGEILEQTETCGREELETFFEDLIQRYLKWAKTLSDWRQLRDATIGRLDFPFAAYRCGQRSMAITVYRTIRDGGQALIQAATGIGKTLAALFPAVKTIGEGHTDRIFFLTARNTGKASATKALDLLQTVGLRLKRVCLTAKDHICFNPEAACDAQLCPYAKGHFDRLTESLEAAFACDNLDRETIETIARAHRVCPFEFSLELSRWADCIVCDYNYAFDPRVYLRRFFDEENGSYVFLVDEAHNLVDRSREMFSVHLDKNAFLELRRAVKSHLPPVYRAAGKINTWMVKAREQTREAGGFQSAASLPDGLDFLLHGFLRAAEKWLAKNQAAPFREIVLECYFRVNGFLRVWDQFDDNYRTCYQQTGSQLTLKLFCLDPSRHLAVAFKRCRAAVFFSATMTPADYFQQILGCTPSATRLAIPSPFPRKNLSVFIARGIDTTYARRAESAQRVADLIHSFADSRTGNYLCFFPSYAYMAMVVERFSTSVKDVVILVQERQMDDADRARFLDQFSARNQQLLVGFAVMGGIFGEGIDLVGERLCGAVVVGVGLPSICPERDLIRDYFDRWGRGFDFAYRYPGINRVLQAGGRVIRTDQDRGALLLVDQRFCTYAYRRLLPEHWPAAAIDTQAQLTRHLKQFWTTDA